MVAPTREGHFLAFANLIRYVFGSPKLWDSPMTNSSPRDFFDNIVKPTFENWVMDPVEEWKAKQAISELNNMAARVFHFWKSKDSSKIYSATNEGEYREQLASMECLDFALVRDVADNHKHVEIGRRSRRVSRSDQTKRVTVQGGTLGSFVLGSDVLGGDEIVTTLDDGTKRSLLELANNVMAMWERLLREMGMDVLPGDGAAVH